MADNRCPLCRLLCYAVPLAMLSFLLLTYLIAKGFYLNYVIEPKARENQFVENATFVCSAISSLILFWSAKRLWRLRGKEALGSCLLLVLLGMAAVFLAGEEVSWGQTYFHWETPRAYQTLSVETNLHNTFLPVQTLGSVFMIVYFFVLPWMWRHKNDLKLPQHLSYAIPKGPVMFCPAVAFLWQGCKSAYRVLNGPEAQRSSVFYRDFLEQINEHKEMLVAVTLLMYACSSYAAIRRLSGKQISQMETPSENGRRPASLRSSVPGRPTLPTMRLKAGTSSDSSDL